RRTSGPTRISTTSAGATTESPTSDEEPRKPRPQGCASWWNGPRRRLECGDMREESVPRKIYRWLLKLYPAGFRETYAYTMEQEFRQELAESTGAWALAMLWIRLLTDLAVSIPGQVAHE